MKTHKIKVTVYDNNSGETDDFILSPSEAYLGEMTLPIVPSVGDYISVYDFESSLVGQQIEDKTGSGLLEVKRRGIMNKEISLWVTIF